MPETTKPLEKGLQGLVDNTLLLCTCTEKQKDPYGYCSGTCKGKPEKSVTRLSPMDRAIKTRMEKAVADKTEKRKIYAEKTWETSTRMIKACVRLEIALEELDNEDEEFDYIRRLLQGSINILNTANKEILGFYHDVNKLPF